MMRNSGVRAERFLHEEENDSYWTAGEDRRQADIKFVQFFMSVWPTYSF